LITNETIKPGMTLSYSAGTTDLNPEKFRVIKHDNNLITGLLKEFPALRTYFTHAKPMIVNCYPATIGYFPQAVFIDSYLKWENFARALMLASQIVSPVIIVGQPLLVFDFLLTYKINALPFPKDILIGLGGYTCPLSLEKAFLDIIGQNSNVNLLYGYGIAEAGFSCLAGIKRNQSGQIIYKPILDHIEPFINKDQLCFRVKNSLHTTELMSGDFAKINTDGWIIENAVNRLDPEILASLNKWTNQDWARKTGYVSKINDKIYFQLRQIFKPLNSAEIEFYKFAERFSFSWLNKPAWGK